MRRLLTVTSFAVASAGLLAGQAGAATKPPPKGAYYGQLSGPFHQIAATKCPVIPPDGPPASVCAQIKGPFTVKAPGGKTLAGNFVGTIAGGDPDNSGTGLGECTLTNEVFTFTVGKGNTFRAVASPAGVNRTCLINLGEGPGNHRPVVLTTLFQMQITGGTGRFKGLQGVISEDGAVLPNVSPTGHDGPDGRANGNLTMVFGPVM
jgi:hypothetical protein